MGEILAGSDSIDGLRAGVCLLNSSASSSDGEEVDAVEVFEKSELAEELLTVRILGQSIAATTNKQINIK